MATNRLQFQPGLSLSEFLDQYGTKAQCEAALQKARWPSGFICPECQSSSHCIVWHGYLAEAQYRFNRRFRLDTLPQRLLIAVMACKPKTEHCLRKKTEEAF